MFVIPAELDERRQAYCEDRRIQTQSLIGYGLEGYVWKTNRGSVVKLFRHSNLFDRELAVYQKLSQLGLQKLQGFTIPQLLDHDHEHSVIEISLVAPPFVLDFAAASLGKAPSEMASPEWLAEKQRMFGRDWPDVQRLLDSLRLYGIHFPDVHLGNIRVRK
ncbi:MAG: hypothetical protein ACKV2Q_30120 [Planctomycetaceae bacterium]